MMQSPAPALAAHLVDLARRVRPAGPRAPVALIALGAAALVVLGAAGCGRRAAPPPAPPDLPYALPSEEEARRVRADAGEALAPPGRADDAAEAPAPPAGEVVAADESAAPAPLVPAEEPEGPPPGTRPGFRVQVFATTDSTLAAHRAVEVQDLFEEPVYVDLEGELFKVRVGDCRDRNEAADLRRRARGLGLEDAFIIDARVRER